MEEILLRVGSKESYDAIRSFTRQLKDVEMVEEDAKIGFPFSKAESDKRLSVSEKQFLEGKTVSLAESMGRTSHILEMYR